MTQSGVRVSRVTGLSLFILGGIFGVSCSESSSPGVSAPAEDAGSRSPAVPAIDAGIEDEAPSAPAPGDAGPGMVEVGPPGLCSPGETRACSIDLLCSGVSTCVSGGEQFGPCECGPTATELLGAIGATCATDNDCAGGGRCMAAGGNDFRGVGGPAGGYCTFDCTDTEECTARDPQSVCSPVGPDSSSVCLRTCLSKAAEPGEAKCLNRTDVACISVVAAGQEQLAVERQLGICAPQCGSDEDCPAGRLCHRQGGVCTDFPPPGAPVGSACSISDDCDGRACEDRVDQVGVCTAPCVLGALSGCGYGREPVSRDAACVTPAVAAGRFSEGPGDLGLCLRLCDSDADCDQVNEALACSPLNPELAAFFGRTGACLRGGNAASP